MNIKDIAKLEIPAMASMAENCIIDAINLLDAILWECRYPQNKKAADNKAAMCDLCHRIDKAYERAKSSLNELQQG